MNDVNQAYLHQHDQFSGTRSRLSLKSAVKSKAYGMENGNWMGMDASIQDVTIQEGDVSTFAAQTRMQEKPMPSKRVSPPRQREMPPPQHVTQKPRSPARASLNNKMPPPVQHSNIIPSLAAKQPSQPVGWFGEQSTIMDETNLFMNQTQNRTVTQVTQTKTYNNGDCSPSQNFQKVNSPQRPNINMAENTKKGSGSKFDVQIKIFYKGEYGESVHVIGSIEELGSWKQFKCPLKWTQGHYWVSESVQISSQSYFAYKYVIMKNEQPFKKEAGPCRIADLDILLDKSKIQEMEQNRQRGRYSPRSQMSQNGGIQFSSSSTGVKQVELNDEWEHFTLRFSIFSSSIEEESQEQMRIMGSIPELTRSGTLESGPLLMRRSKRSFRWLNYKYGQEMRPWECNLRFKIDILERINEIIYGYSKSGKVKVYEREPSRVLQIQNPADYRGELGSQKSSQWRNQDKVWIVNGHIEKADGNFLGEALCSKIGDSGICMGTYPAAEEDVQRLHEAGISGVINLMNTDEFRQRGLNWRNLEKIYKQRGVQSLKFAVNDAVEKDFLSNLFNAAQHLNNLVNNQNLNVFIHCSSGVSRAPAVAITYLCLFKKVKCWDNPDDVAHFVKAFNPNICPNMRMVKKCVEANRDFQAKQQAFNTKVLGDTIEESFYFPNMVSEPPSSRNSQSKFEQKYQSSQSTRSQRSNHKEELPSKKQLIPNTLMDEDTVNRRVQEQLTLKLAQIEDEQSKKIESRLHEIIQKQMQQYLDQIQGLQSSLSKSQKEIQDMNKNHQQQIQEIERQNKSDMEKMALQAEQSKLKFELQKQEELKAILEREAKKQSDYSQEQETMRQMIEDKMMAKVRESYEKIQQEKQLVQQKDMEIHSLQIKLQQEKHSSKQTVEELMEVNSEKQRLEQIISEQQKYDEQSAIEKQKQQQQQIFEQKQKELEKLQNELVEQQRVQRNQEAEQEQTVAETIKLMSGEYPPAKTPQVEQNILQQIYDEDKKNAQNKYCGSSVLQAESNVNDGSQDGQLYMVQTSGYNTTQAPSQYINNPQDDEIKRIKAQKQTEQKKLSQLLEIQEFGDAVLEKQILMMAREVGQEQIQSQEREQKKRLSIVKTQSWTPGAENRISQMSMSPGSARVSIISQTEAELEELQNLRMLEEEKLRLLQITKEVQQQQLILQQKSLELEQSTDVVKQRSQEKAQTTPYPDESLLLDYQNEKPTDQKNEQVSTRESMTKSSMMDCTNTSLDNTKIQNLETMLEDLDEEQFEQKCLEFFANTPIKFKPKKGNKLEEHMSKIIKKNGITIPVMHVRGQLYLIGSIRSNCELKIDQVMVKIGAGGGSQNFAQYIKENQLEHQKTLVRYMIQCKKDLDQVCDKISKGIKIRDAPIKKKKSYENDTATSRTNANQTSIRPSTFKNASPPNVKKLEFQKLNFNETQTNNLSQTERLNDSGHENSRSFSRRSQKDRKSGKSIDSRVQKILSRGLFVVKNDGPNNQPSAITPLKNIDLAVEKTPKSPQRPNSALDEYEPKHKTQIEEQNPFSRAEQELEKVDQKYVNKYIDPEHKVTALAQKEQEGDNQYNNEYTDTSKNQNMHNYSINTVQELSKSQEQSSIMCKNMGQYSFLNDSNGV